jgi:hypothetical protein
MLQLLPTHKLQCHKLEAFGPLEAIGPSEAIGGLDVFVVLVHEPGNCNLGKQTGTQTT